MEPKKEKFRAFGMHCSSCEARIERAIMNMPGVINVKASYENETVEVKYDGKILSPSRIKEAINKAGYSTKDSSFDKIIGVAIIAAAIILLGKFSANFDMESKLIGNVTYPILFIVGAITSLHCVGMCGGIMLSQSIAKEGEGKLAALKPALFYNIGRIISYTILGGVFGAIGSVFDISLGLKASIMIFAGVFMIFMGLNMAGFNVLRKLHIKLPWSSCGLKSKARGPFIVGLLNGFMPCGPLQTMQIYALGTGSALSGATSMFFFSIGTVPLMLFFGAVTGILSKGYAKRVLKFSGILVIVLGFIMSNRGLALTGVNFSPMSLIRGALPATGGSAVKAEIQNGVQIVRMTADYSGYTPNAVLVQKGMPVKWIIDGKQLSSCNNAVVAPSIMKKQVKLKTGENVIAEFTPQDNSDIKFSCWMGMINGVIKVVDNLETADASGVVAPQSSGSSCCSPGASGSIDGEVNDPNEQTSSIYGSDLSLVPTERLIKKSIPVGNVQTVKISGIDFELEPLVIVINKGMNTKLTLDLNEFKDIDGEFTIVDGETGETIKTFAAKKGVTEIQLKLDEIKPYAIVKEGGLMGIIDVVDDVKSVNLESVRDKYFQ